MKTRYNFLILGTILALLILAVLAPLRVFVCITGILVCIGVIAKWCNDMVKQDAILSKKCNDEYNTQLMEDLGIDKEE
jgi:Na+/H+-dicarboxylate symporter